MSGFQMRVDTRQMEVPARVLPNPRLTYGFPASFDPKVGLGSWLAAWLAGAFKGGQYIPVKGACRC